MLFVGLNVTVTLASLTAVSKSFLTGCSIGSPNQVCGPLASFRCASCVACTREDHDAPRRRGRRNGHQPYGGRGRLGGGTLALQLFHPATMPANPIGR